VADWPLDVAVYLEVVLFVVFTIIVLVIVIPTLIHIQLHLHQFPTNPQQLLININTHNPRYELILIDKNPLLLFLYLNQQLG